MQIATLEALGVSVCLSVGCVLAIYLPFNRGDRDSPKIIFRRTVSLAVVSAAAELYLRERGLTQTSFGIGEARVRRFLHGGAVASVLTFLLYAGHILAVGLPDDVVPPFRLTSKDLRGRCMAFRNYVSGPVLEEIIFRRQAIWLWSSASVRWRLVICPLLFSVAHLHHWRRVGFGAVIVQLLYTFVFGAYACLLFESCCTVGAPIAAHIICNVMGLPNFEAIAKPGKMWQIVMLYSLSIVAFALGLTYVTINASECV